MAGWKFNRTKPVIGIAGGIGSGKSTVSRMFGSLGCGVIDSDALAHAVLQSDAVKAEVRGWLGEGVFHEDGLVNRKAVAQRIFGDAASAARLSGMIHPRVAVLRDELMEKGNGDPGLRAMLWDSPLLIEAGLAEQCDAIVFVDVPVEMRRERLAGSRGWGSGELEKREKLQFSLDKKREVADYCIDNSGDEASTLRQVRRILSQILDRSARE